METPDRGYILVGEDNESVGYLIKLILEKAGYAVKHAKNGKELVECSGKYDFDMIMTDIQMPVLDGCTAAKQIKSNLQGKNMSVPIIAITGVDVDNIDKVMAQGCFDDYIIKPFTKEVILGIAEKYIRRVC